MSTTKTTKVLKMSDADRIKYLEEQNALYVAQIAASKPKIGFKVSTKGAVSLTGLRRFPITLYASEWETVLERIDELKSFLKDNAKSLSRKAS